MRRAYLVAYDIADPKRLRRVARTMEDFGGRRQLSVFICFLNETQKVEMVMRLESMIDARRDQILLLPLCQKCARGLEAIGRPTEPCGEDDQTLFL